MPNAIVADRLTDQHQKPPWGFGLDDVLCIPAPKTVKVTDFLRSPCPSFRIDVREPVDAPCWWGHNPMLYYRSTLPARAVGGATPPLRVSIHEGPPTPLRLGSMFDPDLDGRLRDAWTLTIAAGLGLPIAVYGLSTRFNMLPLGSSACHTYPVHAAFVEAIRAAGLPIWVDIDDWYAPPLPHEPIKPWQLDVRVLAAMEAHVRRACRAASGVVVATEALAAMVRQDNPQVRVIATCVDPRDLAQTPRRARGPCVRIGMTGDCLKLHDDVWLVMPGLVDAARLPGVELHIFGGQPTLPTSPFAPLLGLEPRSGSIDGVPYTAHGWGEFFAYQRLAGLLDVAAQPLAPDDRFNRYKSGQKYMELGLHQTAMVLQRMAPYDLAVEGETCLKAESQEEWREQLLRLTGDAKPRRRLGSAARDDVLAHHTLQVRRPLWNALVAEAA